MVKIEAYQIHGLYIKTATFKYSLTVFLYMESQPGCGHLCRECASWKRHAEKCWFYWEGKKECSQFRDDDLSESKYRNVKFNPDEMLADLINKG